MADTAAKNGIRDKLSLMIYQFLLFSLIGWIYEVALAFIYGYGFINRGFLFGPYLPIYGFGALILLSILEGFMGKPRKLGKVPINPILVFLLIVVITTVIEYAASVVMELIFHKRWWDYSHYPLNINGRVCLSASLRFGIGGVIFLYLLVPVFKKLVGYMPAKPRYAGAAAILGVLLADFICTMLLTAFQASAQTPMF